MSKPRSYRVEATDALTCAFTFESDKDDRDSIERDFRKAYQNADLRTTMLTEIIGSALTDITIREKNDD